MIRNVVVHLLNDQPIIADLFEAPSPGDAALICTNLRTTDGKRPTYVDRASSTFVFPYGQVRFVEIHAGTGGALEADLASEATTGSMPETPTRAEDEDLEIDEDFLRRIRDA